MRGIHRGHKCQFDVFFDLRLNKSLSKNRKTGVLIRHRAHYDVTVMNFDNFACSI